MNSRIELKPDTALVIEWNGHVRELEKAPTLDEARSLIGGYVEVINVRQGSVSAQMLVNEDGFRMSMKPNRLATEIAQGFANIAGSIVGNVIILTGKKRWT